MILNFKGIFFVFAAIPALALAGSVESVSALVAAVRDGDEGATVEIAAGTYELAAPLELKARMTLKGAGMDKTILTNAQTWKPSTEALPDPEMKLEGLESGAYLIRLKRDSAGITISDLTLHGPQLHDIGT
jgi:nitrous oxidase accessory protein